MDYLIRFSQSHETFRLPEVQALAVLEGIDMKVVSYSNDVGPSPSPLSPLSPQLLTLSSLPSV